MATASLPTDTPTHDPPMRWQEGLAVAAVMAVFALHAGWQVPDVNEAHYLTKARHFWEPTWAARDFFLNSADSHVVFCVACGWLGKLVSFDAFAWIGRLLTWGLLAFTFTRLCRALAIIGGLIPLAAALFVALNSRFAMAGEWIVGGFEAKGIAYAAVLCGLERLVLARYNQALVAIGVASAFHVLVGGWSAIALGVAWLLQGSARPQARLLLPGLVVATLLALPSLLFALRLNWGVDAETLDRAHRIYVFGRLSHHLLPGSFGQGALLRGAALAIAWILLGRRLRGAAAITRFRGFVDGAILIALVGLALYGLTRGDGSTRASVMRYYWFRLADFAVPLGVALLAIRWGLGLRQAPLAKNILLGALAIVAGASLFDDGQRHSRGSAGQADSPLNAVGDSEWRDVCTWVAANTPDDALFLTPRLTQTFKWYAGRAEVVNLKDVPQDARSIVDWWQRLASIHRVLLPTGERVWLDSLAEQSPARLRELAARYEFDYLIAEREPKLDLERIYSNNSYAVYRLPRD